MIRHIALLCSIVATLHTADAAAPAEFTVGGLSFQRPEKWEWIEAKSPMRKAQLHVPGEKGEPGAEVTFFHFAEGQGGDVDSNIRRWIGQFEGGSDEIDPNVETREIGGTQVTFVRHEGTFLSGMPGGPATPMAGYALVGAIVEGAQGNVFVKMTGPEAVVRDATAAFERMVADAVAPAAR